ncbi:coiled-coil domain-containing protein 18 [Trichosurus vulpecula]|uniref:coiled-coil domain-containing protein 18 n=1 Tax=Trichosurus vulpecula TaxID=9337 RepID=UPI00186B10A3|nr:coiled-coil domain-containing protein 18 [Trichosurus vulpecula]
MVPNTAWPPPPAPLAASALDPAAAAVTEDHFSSAPGCGIQVGATATVYPVRKMCTPRPPQPRPPTAQTNCSWGRRRAQLGRASRTTIPERPCALQQHPGRFLRLRGIGESGRGVFLTVLAAVTNQRWLARRARLSLGAAARTFPKAGLIERPQQAEGRGETEVFAATGLGSVIKYRPGGGRLARVQERLEPRAGSSVPVGRRETMNSGSHRSLAALGWSDPDRIGSLSPRKGRNPIATFTSSRHVFGSGSDLSWELKQNFPSSSSPALGTFHPRVSLSQVEPDALEYYQKDNEEENLLADVASLRNELEKTEWSLQNLGEELTYSSPGNSSENSIHPTRFERLSVDDLVQPFHPGFINYSTHKNVGKMPYSSSDLQRKSRDKVIIFSTSVDQENKGLREKLNKLRQHNASLISQNHTLMNKIESLHFELTQSRTKICILESTQSQSFSIPILEEQIINLEAEVSAQDKVLREAEDKLEQSQKTVIEKEQSLQNLKEKCSELKLDLIEQSKQGKRVEQQRNEAMHNAEELSKAFQEYKQKVAEKLERVQAEEQLLEKNLVNCEKENKRLQGKCVVYREDLESLKDKLRQLKDENNDGKERIRSMVLKNSEIMSRLTESKQNILKLESELEDKEEILREKLALVNENRELKVLITKQNERLSLCQREIVDSRQELNSLEAIISQLPFNKEMFNSKTCICKRQVEMLSTKEDLCVSCCELNKSVISDLRIKLAMKEAEINKLQTNLTASQFSGDDEIQEGGQLSGLETEPVKLSGNQATDHIQCQKLHTANKHFEREKQRLVAGIEELRAKLAKTEAENSELKANMAHRTSQFQVIQEELLEKVTNSSKMESEMTKKCSQILTLEKQLEEKTNAYSSVAAKNSKLEQELMEKNEKIHSLESNINSEHEKMCLAFEKAKKIHYEQHKEMEHQIELLQIQLEKKEEQFKEQEKTVSILQQDIVYKQHHLESLDRLLLEKRGEMEKQNTKKDESLKMLQSQVSEETIKVRQLQSALDMCKEELAAHLCQLEGNKDKFEKQIKKKSEEVYCLQKELKLKTHNLQETTKQNVILQHTLQQQQQMLQDETVRNGELEDSQAKLEKQVSKLEQELQKQKEISAEKLRKMEEKLETASHEADSKRQKVIELTTTARHIKLEMDQCKDELVQMEKEILHLRRDGENKTIQLNHLDMTLEQTQTELDKKVKAVKELEKLQQHSQNDLKEALQKREELETELQNAHVELKNTLKQLQELRDVLQNAQISLEEKYTTIKDLTAELRECKLNIEDKKQELLNMDQALKDRNWELKQRAAQVTQLDITIREHRGEMEQKLIKLEGTVEKTKLELKESNKQIEILEEDLQNSKDQLCEKEFEVLQNEQEISQLKKETERKQQKITEIENILKEQEQCIAAQYKEALDLRQQVRLAEEQMQQTQEELLEARRQQVQAQREAERLANELEETKHLSREKEAHANHLAEELGSSQVRETKLEARLQAEVKKLLKEIESLKEAYHLEMLTHRENRTKWKVSSDSQKSSVQQLNIQLEKAKHELEETQGTLSSLHKQVQDKNEVIQAANEALLVKESEVTRLQAKLSGRERTEGFKYLPVSLLSPAEIMYNIQDSRLFKQPQPSFLKTRKLRRSISASDLSVKTIDNEDLSEELLEDLKQVLIRHPLPTEEENKKDTLYTPSDVFDSVAYDADDDEASQINDFTTLSGMLKYINKEVRLSKKSSISAFGTNQEEDL